MILENCRFSGCDFTHCDFTDTVFRECDFSNCRFAECGFRRCEFHSVKGLGADFTRSRFRDAAAIGCNFEYANFHGAIFDRVLFRRCDLSDAAFTECILKALLPDDSELIRVNFFKTPLKGVDFTSCRLQAPGGSALRRAAAATASASQREFSTLSACPFTQTMCSLWGSTAARKRFQRSMLLTGCPSRFTQPERFQLYSHRLVTALTR